MATVQPQLDPILQGALSESDDDDTATGTFVSVEDFVVSRSHDDAEFRRVSYAHSHSINSSMLPVDRDTINDSELLNCVAEHGRYSAPPGTVHDTSAYMWALDDNAEKGFRIPPQNRPSLDRFTTPRGNAASASSPDLACHESDYFSDAEVKSTPRVVRDQYIAIDEANSALQADNNQAALLAASSGVTSSVIPNPFKISSAYKSLANPDSAQNTLILFGRNGPAGRSEIDALNKLARQGPSPLSKIVEMLLYTVEFQSHELTNLKNAEIDLASRGSHDHHDRFSEIDRRRSLSIRSLLDELDKKAEEIKQLEAEKNALANRLEDEKAFNKELKEHCEGLHPSINFGHGVERAFTALNDHLFGSRKENEMRVDAQNVELDEYAERLLDLEQKVSDGQRRQDALLEENTELKVKLVAAQQGVNDSVESSPFATPAVRCSNVNSEFDQSAIQQEIVALTGEIDELRSELRSANRQKSETEDDLFKARFELDSSKTKIGNLQNQLEDAEKRIAHLKKQYEELETNSRKISRELTQNTIDAVQDLEKREMEVRQLKFELEDRQKAINSYRDTIKHLEHQIEITTKETIHRGLSAAAGEESPLLVQARQDVGKTVASLQKEIDSARELLATRCDELEHYKTEEAHLLRDLKAREKELSYWRTQATMRSKDNDAGSVHSGSDADVQEHREEEFLRRLSLKLGCRAEKKKDLIGKLVKRIEDFMEERTSFERANANLREEIIEREKTLHVLRAEMESEIRALRCEVSQIESARDRAIAEREAAEAKLTEIENDNDQESLGDITITSFGARPSNFAFGDGDTTEVRRAIFNNEDVHWNEPSIDAAVQAVSKLIGSKDTLAARNQKLREKLDKLLAKGFTAEDSAELSRELVLESRSMHEELVAIIGQQQQTIRKLRGGRVSFAPGQTEITDNFDDQTLDAELDLTVDTQNMTGRASDASEMQIRSPAVAPSPVAVRKLSKATSFLRQQLDELREQYTEKMKINSNLGAVIKDMEQKMEHLVSEKRSAENRALALTNAHENFLKQLGDLCDVRASPVLIEAFVRDLITSSASSESLLEEKDELLTRQSSRIYNLLAQKRVLQHMLGIYHNTYNLNILALPPTYERSARRRLGAIFKLVLASVRLRNSMETRHPHQATVDFMDVSTSYDVPQFVNITKEHGPYISLTSASLAIGAVPKLQNALEDREKEIASLRMTLATLNTSEPTAERSLIGIDNNSTFDYSQDIVDRKNDLSKRLRKVIKQKEELEVRLSHEKQHREASDARANKYLEKATSLHRKLQTVKLSAENRERTYKAAIRYLKAKADNAADVDVDDENSIPVENSSNPAAPQNISGSLVGSLRGDRGKSASVLQGELRTAQAQLEKMQKGTDEYNILLTYITGLRKATRRLRKASTNAAGSAGGGPVPARSTVANSERNAEAN